MVDLGNQYVWVVTTEGMGDGSGNYTDYFQPGISVFNDYDVMSNAIRKYLENADITERNIDQLISIGGWQWGDNHWIRVSVREIDVPDLQKQSSNWNIPHGCVDKVKPVYCAICATQVKDMDNACLGCDSVLCNYHGGGTLKCDNCGFIGAHCNQHLKVCTACEENILCDECAEICICCNLEHVCTSCNKTHGC